MTIYQKHRMYPYHLQDLNLKTEYQIKIDRTICFSPQPGIEHVQLVVAFETYDVPEAVQSYSTEL